MKRITILLFLCFLGITMTSAQQKTFKGTWLYEKEKKVEPFNWTYIRKVLKMDSIWMEPCATEHLLFPMVVTIL